MLLLDSDEILTVITDIDGAGTYMADPDLHIARKDVIDALLTTHGEMAHTWIVDSGASFHVTPNMGAFASYSAGHCGKVYLGNNYACDIEGKRNNTFSACHWSRVDAV